MASAPRIETWVSALILSPREIEKLVIYQVAELARRRRDRGLKLNFPESIALPGNTDCNFGKRYRIPDSTIPLINAALPADCRTLSNARAPEAS